MVLDNIVSFLTNRGWVENGRTEKFLLYLAPLDLGIEESFNVYIPQSFDNYGFDSYLKNVYQTLSDIYDLRLDDLQAIFDDDNSVLKIRVFDEEVEGGKITLRRFDSLIEKMTDILSDTASFVIDRDLTSSRVPKEVNRYLEKCNFMQTEIGSFIVKFQLPGRQLLKEQDAFREELYCSSVNRKISEIFSFVNNQILEGNDDIDEDYIITNSDLFNFKLYKDIYTFFNSSSITKIDISLYSTDITESIYNENINKLKLHRLEKVVNKIKEIGDEVGEFTFRGRILSLKSKDPDGVSNVISVGAADNGLPITVTITLDSENYRNAIEAHRLKQSIEVRGRGRKSKETAKILEVYTFTIYE